MPKMEEQFPVPEENISAIGVHMKNMIDFLQIGYVKYS